jgi:hypothetical protein
MLLNYETEIQLLKKMLQDANSLIKNNQSGNTIYKHVYIYYHLCYNLLVNIIIYLLNIYIQRINIVLSARKQ